jgi:hypothetical protein
MGKNIMSDGKKTRCFKFVINLAQTGVHDFETLLAETLERFRH